jgi:hypothetical protein
MGKKSWIIQSYSYLKSETMNLKLFWYILFINLICNYDIVRCQKEFLFQDKDPTGTILPMLQKQVRVQYGNQFNVYFAVFDSMIGNTPVTNVQGAITDPYGTLRGTIFFWAIPPDRDPENIDSVVIGVSKNGNIIWITPPIFKGGVGQIFASLDLNNDGEVDLVTFWSPSYMYDYSTNIMILSWNGTSARLISDFDLEARESKLYTTSSILKLIKNKNKKIYDIKAYWSDQNDMKDYFPSDQIPTRPWVTYKWDGTKYILASKVKQ